MAFPRGATELSHVPSYFELILGVTVESVPGNQVYVEWTGTSGSFGMVAWPLEFLSTFKLTPHPLGMQWETGIPFQAKQGNGPSSPDEEANRGSS